MASRSRTSARGRAGAGRSRRAPAVDPLDARLAQTQRVVLAVVVVLSAAAVWRPLVDPFMLPKLTVLAAGATVLLGLAGVRAVRAGRVTVPGGAVGWSVAALAAALVLATVTADNVALSLVGQHSRYAGLLSYLSFLALFLVSVRLHATAAPTALVRACACALALVTGYGLLQLAGLDPWTWDSGSDDPVFSTFGNTNFAAAWVAVVCPVVAAAVLLGGRSTRWRVAGAGLLVAALAYCLSTGAEQGPAAAAAGLAVVALAWLVSRRPHLADSAAVRLALPGAALLGVAALVALAVLAPRAVSGLGERQQFWQAALASAADFPLLGTGLDSFRDHFPTYRPVAHGVERGFQTTDSAHDLPLAMLAAGGLPLGLAYLAFVGLTGWRLVQGLRTATGERRTAVAGFGGMWAAYQVQSLVSVDVPPLSVLHFLSAAVVVASVAPPPTASLRLPVAPAGRGSLLPSGPASASVSCLVVVGLLAGTALWVVVRPLRADVAAAGGRDGGPAARVAAVDRAVRLAPWEAEYRLLQARSRLAADDQQGAYDASIEAAELRRGSSQLALGVAALATATGDEATAALWAERAARRDPRNPEALEQAAEVLRVLGDRSAADRLAEEAERLRAEG